MLTFYSSVSYSDRQIIDSISQLYLNGQPFHLDPTFSVGQIYHSGPEPLLKHDLRNDGIDFTQLPYPPGTIRSIMFDPPFIIKKVTAANLNNDKMVKRFTSYNSIEDAYTSLQLALLEFYRVMSPAGILTIKIQDTVTSNRYISLSTFIINRARMLGFIYTDCFIKVSKSRLISNDKPKHSRSFHCQYLVFKKPIRKRKSKYYRPL